MSALNIKDEAVADAARELARRRGTTVTLVIGDAVAEALQRQKARAWPQGLAEDILAIARHCQALPLLDSRSEDEILGYGPDGDLDLIAVDSSILVANLLGEPGFEKLARRLEPPPVRLVSVVSALKRNMDTSKKPCDVDG